MFIPTILIPFHAIVGGRNRLRFFSLVTRRWLRDQKYIILTIVFFFSLGLYILSSKLAFVFLFISVIVLIFLNYITHAALFRFDANLRIVFEVLSPPRGVSLLRASEFRVLVILISLQFLMVVAGALKFSESIDQKSRLVLGEYERDAVILLGNQHSIVLAERSAITTRLKVLKKVQSVEFVSRDSVSSIIVDRKQ